MNSSRTTLSIENKKSFFKTDVFWVTLTVSLLAIYTTMAVGPTIYKAGELQRSQVEKIASMASISTAHEFVARNYQECIRPLSPNNPVVCAASIRSVANAQGEAFAYKVDKAMIDMEIIK
jgi:hypothetical protein